MAICALVAIVGAYWFTAQGTLGPWIYMGGQWAAVGLLVASVARRRHRAASGWWLIAAAVALWVAGDTWWFANSLLGREVGWVSPADLAYVLQYGLLTFALVRFVRLMARERDVDAVIDVMAVLTVGLFAMWELVVEPGLAEPGVPGLGRAVGAAYPIFDAVLVALMVRILLVPSARNRSIALAAAGAVVLFGADAAYSVMVQTGTYVSGGAALVDSGWIAAVGLWALAAAHPSMVRVGVHAPTTNELSPVRMAVTGTALALPIPIAVAAWRINGEFHPVEHLLTTAVLTAIAVVRLTRLLRASQRYRTDVVRREAYYRAITQNSSDGVLVLDSGGRVLDASPATGAVLGYPQGIMVGSDALAFVHDDDRARLAHTLSSAISSPGEVSVGETRIIKADGSYAWFAIRGANLVHDDAVQGVVMNIHDITDRKRAEAELAHHAFHDSLTGLANRALFHDRVQHALARLARRTGGVAVLFCDLDGFKTVNDSLGHGAGDLLLREVASRVAAVTRDEDTVARLGGDEFAVLLEGPDAEERSGVVAARVLDAIARPFRIGEATVTPGISIGVAHAGPDSLTADELLRDADTAMYAAKAAGKGCVARFEIAMREAAIERLSLEADLRVAVERGELRLQLQPIVELRNQRVIGFEALVRWHHPERGVLPPLTFIPLAEETGVILAMGTWVLREACAAAAEWADPSMTIAVNVSPRELDDTEYPVRVAEALAWSGLDPARLVLEVTETTVIEDPVSVAARLEGLKRLGVRLAIDDFGTGYSSLQYLRRFPVDILKIDRSFVDTIDPSSELPAIVRGMLELGRTLELELLAEGIEHREQLAGLVGNGCVLGQGFLFARPMDPRDALALIAGGGVIEPVEPEAVQA